MKPRPSSAPISPLPAGRWSIGLFALLLLSGAIGGFAGWREWIKQRDAHFAWLSRHAARVEQFEREQVQQESAFAVPAATPEKIGASTMAPRNAGVALSPRRAALLALAKLSAGGRFGIPLRGLMLRARERAVATPEQAAEMPEVIIPSYYISPEGDLPPRFGELFDLDPVQVASLQHALHAVRDRIEQAVLARSSVRLEADGSYVINVAPGDDELVPYRDEVIRAFRAALGDDGYAALTLLNGERQSGADTSGGIPGLFQSFGRDGHEVIVTRTERNYRYRYESRRGGKVFSSGSGTARDPYRIQEIIGPAVKLLPPGG